MNNNVFILNDIKEYIVFISQVKNLSETFVKVCKKLCDENNEIQESLKNIEPKNES